MDLCFPDIAGPDLQKLVPEQEPKNYRETLSWKIKKKKNAYLTKKVNENVKEKLCVFNPIRH